MCLNCKCGQVSNTHEDPLNITLGRFRLMALRNHMSMEQMAISILATLRGVINSKEPGGDDEFVVNKVKPKMEVKYVPREPRKYLRDSRPKTET